MPHGPRLGCLLPYLLLLVLLGVGAVSYYSQR